MAWPSRRPDRAHDARRREVDLPQAAGADRRPVAGRVPRGRLRAGARRSLHPQIQGEDRRRARAARRRRSIVRRWLLAALMLLALPIAAAAQPSGTPTDTDALEAASSSSTKKHIIEVDTRAEIRHALFRLPLAAALGAALAFRPKRRGTPPRQPAVIQT